MSKIIERKVGKHQIVLEHKEIGNDLLVTVHGGDESHIGGVSIAYATKSHYRNATTVTMNSLSFPGHKDYILSNSLAEGLCESLGRSVVVTVGIHIDDATKEEIKAVVDAVAEMGLELQGQYENTE